MEFDYKHIMDFISSLTLDCVQYFNYCLHQVIICISSHPSILFGLLFVIIVGLSIYIAFSFKNKGGSLVETVTSRMIGQTKPRFRKRDKVIFYGRKMLRKVRQISSQATGGRNKMKKRQLVMKFAKRLLRMKREQPLTLQVKEPSQAFLEEDLISEQSDNRLPSEVVYMLKSIRVFGFFEKPLFLELCKYIEYSTVPAGNLLFSIGELDDSIYVVQNGRVQVFVTEPDGTEIVFKEVPSGESIASLLSIMDVMTGHSDVYKTVSARALEDTNVLRLRVEAFKQLLVKDPESLVRVVQVVMVRLHRVTFTALHNYLGLTTQLIRATTPLQSNSKTNSSSVPPLPSPKSSPSKIPPGKTDEVIKVPKDVMPNNNNIVEASKPIPISEETPLQTSEENLSSSIPSDKTEKSAKIHRTSFDNLSNRRRKISFIHSDKIPNLSPEERYRIAVDGLTQLLGINDSKILQDKLSIREYPPGVCLTQEGLQEDIALFYVLQGCLTVSQKTVDKDEDNALYHGYPGELIGALAVITGEPSLFTVKTRHSSHVAVISRIQTYDILREQPHVVLYLAHTVISRLSPFVRQIDFALDWMNIESGRALYRQDDESDCTYIVLSGRMRSVLTRSDGKKELVGEYGKGDLVGIVEVLTQTKRSTTVMAVRDSELAKLPDGLLNAIKIKYPVVVTRLIHLLGHRILGSLQKSGSIVGERAMSIGSRPSGSNFSTVALLPVTEDVPLTAFSLELYHALTSVGPTLRLTSDIIKKTIGPTALDSANDYRLYSWLGQQEDVNRIVLYQCDAQFSTWTQRCIRQADCVLIVALADQEPTIGVVERQLEHLAIRIQKELILLHRDDGAKPKNTVLWLNMRSWCSSTHHIRCPKRMFARRSPSKMQEIYNRMFENPPSVHSDFSRLARFLTGTSIGLVLGGGGARGSAHVGMIRAIVEAGIPIDMVGGVSIGAFMGALWCQEKDLTTFTQIARKWSYKMNSYWRQILDLTYPVTAMFTGACFNNLIHEVFGDRQVEDLWLPFFTVTTDITDSSMRVHTHGSLWRYIRSSMSLSGYMPPLCDPQDGHLLLDGGYVNNLPGTLWRYVRASMTFAGILPPICDKLDGHLLVDGCYVNNLPADIMHDMGAETIIAIDVGSQDETDLTNYGDTLSGWWLLWKRWNPWASPVKVPSLPEIQSRLAYVSCVRQLEQVKRSDYCTYIRPPIDKYKTLQFGNFDEIMEVGFTHGRTLFTAMSQRQKTLHSLLQKELKEVKPPQRVSLQNATFTDLAEMVCKIKSPSRTTRNISDDESEDSDDEDDQEAGYSSELDPYILSDMERDEDLSPVRRRKLNSLSDAEAD